MAIRILMAYTLKMYATIAFKLCCLALLGSYSQENIQDKYIGCYYDASNQSSMSRHSLPNNALLTIQLCIEQCRLLGTTYAGLQSSEACLCGNIFDVSSPDNSCGSLCPGDQSQYCGGWNGRVAFYSLYAVCEFGSYGYQCDQVCHCRRQAPCDRMAGQCPNGCEEKWFGAACDTCLTPKYIGCFRDALDRDIPSPGFSDPQMTVEFCIDRCASMNNSVAGLQAGAYCFCGETYARYGQISESNCTEACHGSASQLCGGEWANSVYSVCPAGYYGSNCHSQCNCKNNSRCVYMTGECNSTCKAGWAGTSCNIRNCSTANGDCSQNEICKGIDLKFASVTRCRCLPGFQQNPSWGICTDINECNLAVCDDPSTNCINTLGSYECHCKPGYEPYEKTICNHPDAGNRTTQTSTGINQQVVPVGVAIGAAVGSALGAALLVIVIGIGIFMWRRRRERQRSSEDSAERRNRTQPDEKLVSTFDYETLKKRQPQDESTYTELTGSQIASQSQNIGEASETGRYDNSSPYELVKESNKADEEVH